MPTTPPTSSQADGPSAGPPVSPDPHSRLEDPASTGTSAAVLVAAAALGALAPPVTAAVPLMAAGVLSAVAGLGRGVLASRDATALLPPGLAEQGDPVALSRLSGEVLALNEAMARSDTRPAAGIAAVLAGLIDVDAELLYRLSRRTRELGFAFEQVRERVGKRVRFLVVVAQGPDRLLWRILSAERLADTVPASLSNHYEAAPFAYLRLQPGGSVATNIRFRDLFGADARPVLGVLLDGEGRLRDGRHILPAANGANLAMRIFAPADAGAADGAREAFLFELPEGDAPRIDATSGLQRLPVALAQISLDGRVMWLNATAARMLGPRAAPGIALDELLEARGRPLSSLVDEALAAEQHGRPEMVRPVGDTGESFLQITFTRIGASQPTALLAVLTDASELRQLEDKFAQSQKMEAVGKLAGGVAHDFNNLLTAINGHCDLLLIGKDANQSEYSDLMQIRQNANRAAALVRQLLAFSRKQTLNAELLSVADVISDTLYMLDRLIGERVTLVLDPAPDGDPGLVRADHRQLEQALMNLVVNARDAMPGGGSVTISVRPRQVPVDEDRGGTLVPAGGYVEVAVADQGTGIDEKVIGRIFDPFFTTKPQGEGTGLGLSTVYGIVKQSGGVILAENRPEGGACFRILLPRAEGASAADLPREAAAEAPSRPGPDLTGQGSILLVEDEAAVRSFTSRALRLRGYDVHAAEAAEDALALLARPDLPLDLVVSDVIMPGMDGPTMVARARELRPGIRVLFVSGYAEEAVRRSIESPEFHFLPKPFSLSELTAKVKEILSMRD